MPIFVRLHCHPVLLGAFAYATGSIILLYRPWLLHKNKKPSFNARNLSHRGGAGECGLENTITAFRNSLKCGSDMLELDCQITADGKVVVAHDDYLERVAGVKTCISELTFEALPPIKETQHLDFDTTQSITNLSDRRIPLLEEVFEAFPNVPISIDIKVNNDDLIHKVAELVRLYRRQDLTVWGNFYAKVTSKCYKEVLRTILLFYSGLLPFVPIKESVYAVCLPSIYLRNPNVLNKPDKSLRFLLSLVEKLFLRRALISHLQRRGIRVYLWVLNSETEFRKAFCDYGVDAVVTDFPSRLSNFLKENQLNEF